MLKANAKVFIVYEDPDSFAAISGCAVFPENLPQIPRPEEMAAVNFSEFWVEQTWGTAVRAVTGVNTIIFSLSGRMDLPVPVRRWMETWPNFEQTNHTTLIVVFQGEPVDGSKQNVLVSYFQRIAENHGLDFLCHRYGAKHFPVSPQSPERPGQMDIPHVERNEAFDLLAVPNES
jgi:hypothetical protein